MNVTLVMVASLDGKITRGEDPDVSSWASKEDQHLFASRIEGASLIVMGRATYEVAKEKMLHRSGRKRVVMTQSPARYTQYAIPDQLEFTDESPQSLIDRCSKEGYTDMLLVGGGEINAAFFQAGLVDELHLTVEPVLLGAGKPLVASLRKTVSLTLVEAKQLNERGTLLVRYHVNK